MQENSSRTPIHDQLTRYLLDDRIESDWDHIAAVAAAVETNSSDSWLRDGMPTGGDVPRLDVAAALQLLHEHRMAVDLVELTLVDALGTTGWGWEQIAALHGSDSRKIMRQHRRRYLRYLLRAPSLRLWL
ncbi:hypothetical protein [Nocardia heshunensis]